MRRHIFSLPSIILFLIFVYVSCTTNITGTGTDTSTRDVYATVNGTILDDNNKPAIRTIVSLVPSEYNPVTDSALSSSAFDTTDTNGFYSVANKAAGKYNIIAVSENSSRIAFRKHVNLTEKKQYSIGAEPLRDGHRVAIYPNKRIISDSSTLFFKGTLIKAKAQDTVSFINLPDTTTSLCYTNRKIGYSVMQIKDSIFTDSTPAIHLFTVLLILKNPSDSGNRLLYHHFKQLGFDTITSDGLNISNIQFSTVDLIFIAPSADSKSIDTVLRTLPVPLINCKHVFFNSLGFTDNNGEADYGDVTFKSSLYIYNSQHPITAGFNTFVPVFTTDKSFNFGNVKASSVLATSGLVTPFQPVFFCFEKNEMMNSLIAPARRVGFFVDTNNSLLFMTENGWTMFDRTVLWAVGRL
jgi:hypothetical protein